MSSAAISGVKLLPTNSWKKTAVFRGEGFRGFLLEHVGGAQEHAQELGDQFGVGVAELLVAHEHGGQDPRRRYWGFPATFQPLSSTEEHVRCPQADAVADAAVERREALRLIDVLDGDVAFLEAEHAEPVAQGEVGGRTWW